MAEHNGGNRRNDRGPFRGNNNSGGEPRGFRARSNRDGSDSAGRPERGGKPFGDRDRKPFTDRPRRDDGDRRSYGAGERKPYGDRENRPFGDRPRREEGERRGFGDGDRDRKPFADRPRREDGERRSFGGGDRDPKPFGDRPRREEGERRSFGGGDRDRKTFGDRPRREDGERRSFGGGDRDRKPFGDRPRREDGDRRRFGAGDNRKPFGDRQDRGARNFDRSADRSADRGPDRGFSRGPARGEGRDNRDGRDSRDGRETRYSRDNRDSGPRGYGRQEDRPARVPNVRDLRSANRPDRERSPEIDEDVTGKELDRATQHQIKTLEAKSAEWVARHLVMAGRLIDEEPELAFQHAVAASRRGGRLAAVREAVGLTAYAAGHYGEALREFRTYRRISGSNVHLPVMADCERGLGRPDRALDVARSEEAQDLDAPGKVELAIVAAGARTDLGQLDAAVAELEIPQLDINRAFSYSPRLFRAYGDALAAAGREAEAEKWKRQAVVAENALGQGIDEEPDIIDLGWDEEEEAREEAERRRLLSGANQTPDTRAEGAGDTEGAGDAEPADDAGTPVIAEGASAASPADVQDANIDDAEADYFVSDDAESDQDSAEEDEGQDDTSNADRNED